MSSEAMSSEAMSSEAMSNATPSSLEQEQAKQRVGRFVRRFQPSYRLLAYYAALPLVLTPDLLHYLRVQFLRGSGVPWVGEVDLLLSELCRPVGYEQYAMDTAVRAALYEAMEQELGQPKIVKAAQLLVRYVTQMAQTNPYLSDHELRSQQWGAIAYINPERVVREVATAYQQAAVAGGRAGISNTNRAELLTLSLITQELAPQLKKYPKLLEYATVLGQALVDPKQVPSSDLQHHYQVLDGVHLRLPEGLRPEVPSRIEVDGQPVIRTFEFDVATLVFDDEPNDEPDLPAATRSQALLPHQFQPFEFQIATVQVGLVDSATLQTQRVNRTPLPFADVFELIDEAIFAEGGIHLSEAQRLLLDGAWNHKTYAEIAAAAPASDEQAMRQTLAPELWALLSALFGEKVSKTTLRSAFVRWKQQGAPRIQIVRRPAAGRQFVERLGDAVTLDLLPISGGRFVMGSPEQELERYENESPPHEVSVEPFLMGKYPVTQAQWRAVAALPQIDRALKPEPSHFKGDDRPVEQVSWLDAVEFCRRLSRHTKQDYRLPTEAEWEYACRAGTTTPFHFGETITTNLANYRGTDDKSNNWSGSYGKGPKGEYREETTPVGSFEVANAFGLYDMHGNVWEWCLDHWHSNYEEAPADGSAWLDNDDTLNGEANRLLRGGSWVNNPWLCRSACRVNSSADDQSYYIGFRVVCGVSWT